MQNITKLNFIKADLDTVCTAAILLSNEEFEALDLVKLDALASAQDLADPKVLCIESGGDGHIECNNFDHHQKVDALTIPCDEGVSVNIAMSNEQGTYCSAIQAFVAQGMPSHLVNLVNFVSYVDTRSCLIPVFELKLKKENTSLSDLFNGMRLIYRDEVERFKHGFYLLKEIMEDEDKLEHPEDIKNLTVTQQQYLDAKIKQKEAIEKTICDAKNYYICGVKVSALETNLPGVHGLLKRHGAEISIAKNTETSKISISVDYMCKVDPQELAYVLNQKENNKENTWGGHPSMGIISSPYQGTKLDIDDVIKSIIEITAVN